MNAKCSGNCFYMNPNIQWNFQIFIDILLKSAELGTIDILPLERQGYYFIGLNGMDFDSWD